MVVLCSILQLLDHATKTHVLATRLLATYTVLIYSILLLYYIKLLKSVVSDSRLDLQWSEVLAVPAISLAYLRPLYGFAVCHLANTAR